MKIQEAAENYLETVLMVSEKRACPTNGRMFRHELFPPTVSVALRDLAAEGYLNIDEDGFITLTEAGQKIAARIYERHCVLSKGAHGAGDRRGYRL